MRAKVRQDIRKMKLYFVLCLASELLFCSPAVSANTPPEIAALEVAAASNDQSAATFSQLAGELDNQNGQAGGTPTLILDKYQKAASGDENAASHYEAAEKDWNQAADKYKAAADAVKGFNDTESAQLAGISIERKKSADSSKQNAIKAYLAGAVEHDKGALRSATTLDKATETAAAAKDRDSAAQVK
jgi:hypothetical protein